MAFERNKEVEKMIARVEKKKDLTHALAIEYMLGVATGRLAALWRYENSLPEGKVTKGILQVAGRKKRAEKTRKISALPVKDAEETPKKKRAPKAAKEPKAEKSKKPAKKRKAKKPEQIEIVTSEAAAE